MGPTPERAALSDQSLKLITRVASLYYLEHKTQSEIAKELRLSRQKVQRLLHEARTAGIVEMSIRTLPLLHLDLERQLKSAFSLYDAIVTASHPDEALQAQSVAQAAAGYLERYLTDSSIVAVSVGRSVGQIATYLSPEGAHPLFVSALGGVPHPGKAMSPNDICRALAAATGGHAEYLYAPAYVESQQVRDLLLSQQAVRQALDCAKRANIALIGIGGAGDDTLLVRAGCLSVDEVRRLRAQGAVSCVSGSFLDQNGREVSPELQGRLVGLTPDDLRRIPLVIALSAEPGRGPAILSALRAGIADVLITTRDNAYDALKAVALEGHADGPEGAARCSGHTRAQPPPGPLHNVPDQQAPVPRTENDSARRL